MQARWRLLVVEEAAFWLLFAGVTLVRWLNPDLWHPSRGGEKPMDFAYLNAVLKSAHFPPFDPWFSGGYINYYYFGFVLIAVLVKLTAIVPAVAYNLAIGTLAAFLGTAAFGVAAALVRPARRARAGCRTPSPARWACYSSRSSATSASSACCGIGSTGPFPSTGGTGTRRARSDTR